MTDRGIGDPFFDPLFEPLFPEASLYFTCLITTDYIGHLFTFYFPLIYTVFHLILFSNLIGMVPYSTTSTVEIVMTLSIALTLLIAVLLRGFLSNGVVLLAAFLSAGTP